jgi:phosphoesterase RecJ-like protein
MKSNLLDIKNLIENSKHIALFGHDNPDGDAIGSLLWLGKILENMGKKVYYFTNPSPSKIFDFLPWIEKIKSKCDYKNKYDCLIFVDFSPYDRTLFTAGQYDYFDQKPLIIIDHHLGDCPLHALVLKDEHADSNCEWIFENTKDIRSDYYDADVASYLYLWLCTDTGNFQYDKQWSRSLRNASALVDLGANKYLITKKMFGTLRLAQLQLLSIVMSRFHQDKGVWYVWYTYQDFEDYGLDREEAAGFITTIISRIEWLRLAVIFKVEIDAIKISLRSQDEKINAALLAAHYNGWGHFYAAGAKIVKWTIHMSNTWYISEIDAIMSYIHQHID